MTVIQKPRVVKVKNGGVARQHLFHTFSIDYESDIDEQRYYGKFTTKKLSISDLAAIGVRKTQLNGGYHHSASTPGYGVDAQTDDFNSMIAHLEIAITDAPAWWDLQNISDTDVMSKVFEEVIRHENSFLERRRAALGALANAQSDGDEQEPGESDLEESGPRRVAGSLVEPEVSTALEP